MSDESNPSAEEASVDPVQLEHAYRQLREQQNLALGAVAGAATALAGAGLWAVITVATEYQIGWMAVGIGFAVGYVVRATGKGVENVFGMVGALMAFLGCAIGNLLAVCGFVARQEGMAFLDVLSKLTPDVVQELMVATFSPMDVVFYAIAIYFGYKLSFRQLTQEELDRLLHGSASGV